MSIMWLKCINYLYCRHNFHCIPYIYCAFAACGWRCRGLIILETYTTLLDKDLELPGFLEIIKEITKDGNYSMYKLSKKDSDEVNRVSPSPRTDGVPETIADGVIWEINTGNVVVCHESPTLFVPSTSFSR